MATRQRTSEDSGTSTAGPIDGHEVAITLGSALRARRKSHGLTLQQLAEQCGLSQPFLSQLENGKAMPSLLALHQVAAALGTSAQILLQPATSADTSLVRAEAGESYELVPGATVSFLVKGSDHMIEANLITAQPGTESTCDLAHEGEEMIYVLEGSISVRLRDHETVELSTGDAYTYAAATPHGWRNIGPEIARFFFISSPPSF